MGCHRSLLKNSRCGGAWIPWPTCTLGRWLLFWGSNDLTIWCLLLPWGEHLGPMNSSSTERLWYLFRVLGGRGVCRSSHKPHVELCSLTMKSLSPQSPQCSPVPRHTHLEDPRVQIRGGSRHSRHTDACQSIFHSGIIYAVFSNPNLLPKPSHPPQPKTNRDRNTCCHV